MNEIRAKINNSNNFYNLTQLPYQLHLEQFLTYYGYTLDKDLHRNMLHIVLNNQFYMDSYLFAQLGMDTDDLVPFATVFRAQLVNDEQYRVTSLAAFEQLLYCADTPIGDEMLQVFRITRDLVQLFLWYIMVWQSCTIILQTHRLQQLTQTVQETIQVSDLSVLKKKLIIFFRYWKIMSCHFNLKSN